jgi:hypothetical protein
MELPDEFLENQTNPQLVDLVERLTEKFYDLMETKNSKKTESKNEIPKEKLTHFSIRHDNFLKFNKQMKI